MAIKLDKKEYYIYEPIGIIIEITNESSEPISFAYDPFTSNFNLAITYNGKKSNCQGESENAFRPIVLESGETYYRSYNMLAPFGCTNSPYEKGLYLDHLMEGDYTIELEYNFGKKILNKEDLKVKSNKLDFVVKKPHNIIHKTQLKKCLDIFRNFKKINIDAFSDAMTEIIELDKYSPYSIFATKCLISRYKFSKYSKARELMFNFCKDFPNSNLALSFSMNDSEVLEKIINSKELNGKFIQKYSKKIKKANVKIKYVK